MLREDRERLEQPYPASADSATDGPFADALGLDIASVDQLAQEVLADLDPTVVGVRWWAPGLADADLRARIGDYLLCCVDDVSTNLIEAKVHLLELRGAVAAEQEWLRHTVTMEHGRFSMRGRRRESPMDDLGKVQVDIHLAGFMRAVGSTLDCFAAAVIGVLGLPTNILQANFPRIVKSLEQSSGDQPLDSDILARASTTLLDALSAAGPTRWWQWATDYRNMLVHRARRLQLLLPQPDPPFVVDSNGQPIVRNRAMRMLVRDPHRSEIQDLAENLNGSRLEEDLLTTAEGVMGSVHYFVREGGETLLRAWRERRASPGAVPQPASQWPSKGIEGRRFAGYAPGRLHNDVGHLSGNPRLIRRLLAAGFSTKQG